ncbi:MAG: hypothetical protein ACLRMZ_21845 [Blautia marasmi]
MREWLGKIKESCAYMSDIITTVKGLATNMNTNNIVEFTVDEVFRRVFLLMKHSLAKHSCILSMENELPGDAVLKGISIIWCRWSTIWWTTQWMP